MTHTRTAILELLERYDLSASRALGQNFVADPNTVRHIARLAGVGPKDHVVEIGAGLGSLTLALAETGAQVTAVELDRYIVPALTEAVSETNVRIVHDDAMTLDWSGLLTGCDRWVLVANLPYNIATPLLCDLLDDVPAISRMLVMVQHEVGERLAAHPGDRTYGIPSVKVSYWATAKVVGKVSPEVFVPKPKVDSALVSINRPVGGGPRVAADADVIFRLVRSAFGQRRKMLRRSLADLVDDEVFARAGVSPTARPETLELDQWAALANALGY